MLEAIDYVVDHIDLHRALLFLVCHMERRCLTLYAANFSNFLSFLHSADGMLFGALGSCPVCSGSLYYYNGQYQCSGNVSEWSKCTYSTMEPMRVKKKWQIPDGIENDFLTFSY
jgi:hypothetical protein